MSAAGLWHPTPLDYVGIVIVFALLCCLTGWIATRAEKTYRRWACRREMARMQRELANATHAYLGPLVTMAQRRQELESLATAEDKKERRLH